GCVRPLRIVQSGRNHVLGQGVQLVRPDAAAGGPPAGEPLVTAPPHQQRVGPQRLGGLDPGPLLQIRLAGRVEPAAVPEALGAVRVLDDPVERHVGRDDDLPHLGSPFRRVTVTSTDTTNPGDWALLWAALTSTVANVTDAAGDPPPGE